MNIDIFEKYSKEESSLCDNQRTRNMDRVGMARAQSGV